MKRWDNERMHEKIVVNKDLDGLGRLVIPKEMRILFNLKDEVELVVTQEGVLVRNPKYKLVKNEDRTNT